MEGSRDDRDMKTKVLGVVVCWRESSLVVWNEQFFFGAFISPLECTLNAVVKETKQTGDLGILSCPAKQHNIPCARHPSFEWALVVDIR